MSHVLFLYLERAYPILLLQPAPQSYPDIAVELIKHSTRVDRSVVARPSSYQRVDCFKFVQVIIIEGLFIGHFLHLLLDPFQALFCRLHEYTDDIAVSGSITAEDVVSQEVEAVNDVGDDSFLFA